MAARIITVAIQKGGTGKTTTAAALAQAAAHRGQKVLAIDLDPQGNLGIALAGDRERSGASDFLQGAHPGEVIQTTPQGIDFIPAGRDLAALATGRGSARRLQKALDPIKGKYDVVIIDTPTKAGELQYNALQAATDVILPMQSDLYDMESFFQTVDTARAFMKSNPALKIAGIFFNKYSPRTTLDRQMKEQIEEYAGNIGVKTLGTVRQGVALREAVLVKKSIYQYAPRSNPARDFLKIYDELMEQ